MRFVGKPTDEGRYLLVAALAVALTAWLLRGRGSRLAGGRLVRLLRKVVGWLVHLAVAVTLVAVIAWFTVPRLLGWEPQVVLSGSMEPTLPRGSVAFVEPRAPEAIQVGDILTYRHPEKPDRLVTHRVVEVLRDDEGLAFRTKGDANDAADKWVVPAGNAVGTVRYSLPHLGYLTQRVRTPLGFALVVGLPAALIILGELRNIARQLRRQERGMLR